MNIDVHAHYVPEEFLDRVRIEGDKLSAKIEIDQEGNEILFIRERSFGKISSQRYDIKTRLADMANTKVDMQIISPSPYLFYYWAPINQGIKMCRMLNEDVARVVKSKPESFQGMAIVPLQDVNAAIKELERAVTVLKLKGVMIGANINAIELDEPKIQPFFKSAEEFDIPIFIHPHLSNVPDRLGDYYLVNIIGNPLDTTMAAARLIYSGIIEKYPNLKIVLSHAGGYLPWAVGRMDHGFKVRPECKRISELPRQYVDKFYFDTITHFPEGLEFLIKLVGSERVLMGSDYPYDMGYEDPVQVISALDTGEENKQNMLGKVSMDLYQIGKG